MGAWERTERRLEEGRGRGDRGMEGYGGTGYRNGKREFEVLVVRALDKFDFVSAACLGLTIQLGQDQGGWGQGCRSVLSVA